MSRYADIIERLEKAEGPDRDLGRLIALETGGVNIIEADNYTASLDAAVGLVERVIQIQNRQSETWDNYGLGSRTKVRIWGAFGDHVLHGEGVHNIEPLAWLLALFHALQSQENSSE